MEERHLIGPREPRKQPALEFVDHLHEFELCNAHSFRPADDLALDKTLRFAQPNETGFARFDRMEFGERIDDHIGDLGVLSGVVPTAY